MPKYKQTVKFYKRFEFEAKNASEANEKMDELVSRTEWDGDVEHDGYEVYEDDPVECPECKGNCTIGEGDAEKDCDHCKGTGAVPFEG